MPSGLLVRAIFRTLFKQRVVSHALLGCIAALSTAGCGDAGKDAAAIRVGGAGEKIDESLQPRALPSAQAADSAAVANEVDLRNQGRKPTSAATSAQSIADQYIVQVRAEADPEKIATALGIVPIHVYRAALNGFAAHVSPAQLAQLKQHPQVTQLEADQMMHASATQALSGGEPWGLDRIDEHARKLNTTYIYNHTASTVRAYIIDTGIEPSHPEFGTRASAVYDATGGDGHDTDGHGTHVAGTVGGQTYGVAKAVLLRGVRVLVAGSGGPTSNVIAGIDWVTANHINPAVANLSVGGPKSSAVNTATANLVKAGVFVAAAAGNDSGANACDGSPSSALGVMTIGATTKYDALADYSNIGSCVDILAPGTDIRSALYTGGWLTMSGTSMATPHVTGTAALYKQVYGDMASSTLVARILSDATAGAISGVPSGTPNILLYQPL